jgi:hypothetical protein
MLKVAQQAELQAAQGGEFMSDPLERDENAKSNKRVALLIAVLALLLAFADLGGGNADNEAVELNVESANLWSFYQAKTIRRTSTLIAAEEMELRLPEATPEQRARLEKRIAEWRATAARYESEPETGEGRRELMARAVEATSKREVQKARGDIFDAASALLQIGIVLATATIITGAAGLAFGAAGLGVISVVLMTIAMVAPLSIGSIF